MSLVAQIFLFIWGEWCGAPITLKYEASDLASFFKFSCTWRHGKDILVNKDDPALVVIRPLVNVNFSGNYIELDFHLMCGRKDRSSEYTINIQGSYRKSLATFFLHCKQGTADEGEYSGRWNQLLCYPWVSCDVNRLHHVTSITPNKMAKNDMSFHQRAVIEFLIKEEILAAEIHQRLQRAYGSVCMGMSSVRRWVKHFKDGNTSIQDQPRSGRPWTASTECNKERVDKIIQDDRRVTVDTIARTLGIGHYAVPEMIESLGYRKVCAHWVPRLLTEDHKGQWKAITSELLQRYRHEGNDFWSVLWQVTKADFTISSLKRNGRVWNGTICILHQKRRQRQYHKLQRWWAQSSRMQRGWFWLNSWNLGKPLLLLVMSRHCTSSVVHCAINVRDDTSSSCMTTLTPTLLASHWKQLQRWGGKFFHIPPIALIWHPPTTIFSDLWRICADNVMRQQRKFRKQCISVFWWLERNFTEGEFSNSQNTGRNVYKEVAIMWKNKERSVD